MKAMFQIVERQDCASSYYEDLSFSLNNLDDATLGCTSGIRV